MTSRFPVSLQAAESLPDMISPEELEAGRTYPSMGKIRWVLPGTARVLRERIP